ncbi:phospholipase D2 isoform X1 [Brachionus plicatilis]|uniref:Phospholipase n=1 Tax=Brachionus plicatilis TaxID=10195 RepID=A0A3M7QFM2_BRAPC|nr:phospholipase D2 isoform X1 [Brachionus plicatilis]
MSKWSSNNANYWNDKEKSDERDMNNNRFEHISEFFPIRQSSRLAEPSQTNTTKVYKYENAYKEPFQLDLEDSERENVFFSSTKPIFVQIIDHEQESSLLVLQRTVYIIRIMYDQHKWTIRKRFKNFLKLYETFALFKAKQNLKNIAHLHSGSAPTTSNAANNPSCTNDVQVNQSKFKPTDHFKLLLQSIPSDFSHARNILEKFLQECVDNTIFRNHNETLKFLEVSHLSFIKDLGDKNKEGMMKKHSFNAMCCSLFNFSFFWDSRWLVIKDTWIGYMNPKTGTVRQIMLVDQSFKVLVGEEQTGTRKGLIIENLTKTLILKCVSERQAKEWKKMILNMALTTGGKFFNTQRFQSFAPIRDNSSVKWFVDAADYMESVADSIEAAKEEIFITGFFISPEIYLKRPIIVGDRWRLDKLLQRKAEEGVKIYILIYKEIEITLPINSAYSKRIFTLGHKNIKVLRHPDHLNEPNKIWSIMWAHHEKLVMIDQSVAYFGGIDLCFGRWDNHLHKLTDMGSVLPNQESQRNFSQVFNPIPNDSTSKSKNDSVQLLGFSNKNSITNDLIPLSDSSTSSNSSNNQELPSILSISRKIRYKERIRRIEYTYDNQVESDSEHQEDHLERSKSLKRSKSLDVSLSNRMSSELSHSISEASALPLTNRQMLNEKLKIFKHSIKSNTHNIKLFREYSELPILNQLKTLKDNFKRYKQKHFGDNDSEINSSFEYNEDLANANCRFTSEERILEVLHGSTKYWVGKDYCNFNVKDVRDVDTPFKDLIDRASVPRMPWHDVGGVVCGPAARDIARHFIQRWNYIKQKKVSKNKNYPILLPKNYHNFSIPAALESKCWPCSVQVLRSISSWSAGLAKTETSIHEAMKYLIQTSKHYIYIENQFFVSLIDDTTVYNQITECLYERIVRAARDKEIFKVYVFIPLIPGYEGEYGKSSGVLLHAITHYNNSSINGLIRKLSDASIEALNYLCFFSMRNWAELNGKLVTELIYVHSKLILVDDRACIIGSANINDRSLLGNRDSEVALLVEDTRFVKGIMNKKECGVGKFCSSLRHRLFKEFLGELGCNSEPNFEPGLANMLPRRKSFRDKIPSESIDISDPCSDEFYKQVMLKYAAQNTRIYDLVFKTIPCDYVSNFQQLKEYQKQSCLNQKNQTEAKLELSKIKGYIVLYPYRFLCFEDLTPQLGTKEKLVPSSLFT